MATLIEFPQAEEAPDISRNKPLGVPAQTPAPPICEALPYEYPVVPPPATALTVADIFPFVKFLADELVVVVNPTQSYV